MPTMNSGLGGPAGFGEGVFSASTGATNPPLSGNFDDGFVTLDITSVFGAGGLNFFGINYTDIQIESNGFISFGSGSGVAQSSGDLGNLNLPAIVPFWADIDITKGGEIYWDLDPTNGNVTITWDGVAPFDGTGTNSFQLVLSDAGGGDFDIEIIYEDIQWATGNNAPSGNAVTGITDGLNYNNEFDGSGNAAELLAYESNDFGGGDPVGTFASSVQSGLPEGFGVDGTAGDDTMALGYTDADGDQITDTDNLIYGGAGADSIDGEGGDDTIYGGSGNDTISGGSGDTPIIYTTVNNGDNLQGTSGVDAFEWSGGSGLSATIRLNNSAPAGDGDGIADYVAILTTDDSGVLTIGDFDVGTDRIFIQENWTSISTSATAGNVVYTLTYANGNQQTFDIFHDNSTPPTSAAVFSTDPPPTTTSDNNDTIYGDDGDDTIVGGAGDDELFGGAGDDDFEINENDGNDTIDGGADTDLLDVNGSTGYTISAADGGAGSYDNGVGASGTFTNIERVRGSDGDDTFNGASNTQGVSFDGGDGDDTLTGGSGDDTLKGGDGDDTFVFGRDGSTDTVTDFDVGDDNSDGVYNDQLDVSALRNLDGNPVNTDDVVVTDDGFGNARLTFPEGESIILQGVTPAQMSSGAQQRSAGIPCFAAHTLIETSTGPVPVQQLTQGDLVVTLEYGVLPVRWSARSTLGDGIAPLPDAVVPVRIKPGTFGNQRALVVSPQHCLLFDRADRADRSGAQYVRAKHLAEETSLASYAHGRRSITYHHVMLDRHATIISNDIPSETFYPGPQALRLLGQQAKCSLARADKNLFLFPVEFAYGARAHSVMSRSDLRDACILSGQGRGMHARYQYESGAPAHVSWC